MTKKAASLTDQFRVSGIWRTPREYFCLKKKFFVWYKTWNFNKIQDFLCKIVNFLFLLKECFNFLVDFSRQYSVKHLFELRLEGLLKYSLCQKKGASVLCVTYYCKKIKKHVCKAILVFSLRFRAINPFLSFVFFVNQSGLLMNEVYLPAGEVADDRRMTENN